jgi:hypothetical protein
MLSAISMLTRTLRSPLLLVIFSSCTLFSCTSHVPKPFRLADEHLASIVPKKFIDCGVIVWTSGVESDEGDRCAFAAIRNGQPFMLTRTRDESVHILFRNERGAEYEFWFKKPCRGLPDPYSCKVIVLQRCYFSKEQQAGRLGCFFRQLPSDTLPPPAPVPPQ